MANYVYTIFLDAGHGGSDPGAVYKGRQEKDDTLALTLAVGEILESYGFRVIYSRTEDIYESPYQKAAKANASGADIFISIHRNSSPYPNQYSGVENHVTKYKWVKVFRKKRFVYDYCIIFSIRFQFYFQRLLFFE